MLLFNLNIHIFKIQVLVTIFFVADVTSTVKKKKKKIY